MRAVPARLGLGTSAGGRRSSSTVERKSASGQAPSAMRRVKSAARAAVANKTRDKDYIVRNGEVVIIDEFTGRMMPGRRYSEGLHQALEAKEHQPIQPENQTLAS